MSSVAQTSLFDLTPTDHLALGPLGGMITRQPLGDQVPDAEIALISGFGLVNYDRGVCTGAAALKALR